MHAEYICTKLLSVYTSQIDSTMYNTKKYVVYYTTCKLSLSNAYTVHCAC